jgi:putative membrane protein
MAKADSTPNGTAKLSHGDRKFIEEAAKGGMAEVQLGKLAAEKAENPQVKQFGQRMVDDHTKANSQLQQLASTKNVQLPQDIDRSHRREYERLQKLSGTDFDREYMKHMVSDHKKDVKEFQKTAKSAKDPDLKNFAQTTLPTLEEHLRQAQTDEAAVKSSGNNKQRQASSS